MFKCALGKCRLEVCLVFMLGISEFAKYCSLLFDTNVSKESIYCDINGRMFNSLNKFLQDSLTEHCCTDIIGSQGRLLLAYGLDDRSQSRQRESGFPF